MKELYLVSFGGQVQTLCLSKEKVQKLTWASFAVLHTHTCIAIHAMIGSLCLQKLLSDNFLNHFCVLFLFTCMINSFSAIRQSLLHSKQSHKTQDWAVSTEVWKCIGYLCIRELNTLPQILYTLQWCDWAKWVKTCYSYDSVIFFWTNTLNRIECDQWCMQD